MKAGKNKASYSANLKLDTQEKYLRKRGEKRRIEIQSTVSLFIFEAFEAQHLLSKLIGE